MTHDKRFRSRRDMLTSAGRLYIGTVVAPALGSAAVSLPAEATPAPHPNISEEQTEATAEKVVDALEGAYGQHKGQRRNHTKGLGARGIFVGNLEAAFLRGNLRVKSHLKEQIAQLFDKLFVIATLKRVQHLVGLFDEIGS